MSPRKSRRGNFTRGRIWLVAIFFLLFGLNYFLCLTCPPAVKREVVGAMICITLWSIFLLGAIWFRKNWARYAMAISILIAVGLSFIFEARLAEYVDQSLMLIMAAVTAGYLAAALILIFSPSIQKLTNNAYI